MFEIYFIGLNITIFDIRIERKVLSYLAAVTALMDVSLTNYVLSIALPYVIYCLNKKILGLSLSLSLKFRGRGNMFYP